MLVFCCVPYVPISSVLAHDVGHCDEQYVPAPNAQYPKMVKVDPKVGIYQGQGYELFAQVGGDDEDEL
jgi:hypothetical protein